MIATLWTGIGYSEISSAGWFATGLGVVVTLALGIGLMALPVFGRQMALIFTALGAKRLGVRPEGWEQAVGDYALDGHRSVADVVDPTSLQKVRDYKKQKKAAAKP